MSIRSRLTGKEFRDIESFISALSEGVSDELEAFRRELSNISRQSSDSTVTQQTITTEQISQFTGPSLEVDYRGFGTGTSTTATTFFNNVIVTDSVGLPRRSTLDGIGLPRKTRHIVGEVVSITVPQSLDSSSVFGFWLSDTGEVLGILGNDRPLKYVIPNRDSVVTAVYERREFIEQIRSILGPGRDPFVAPIPSTLRKRLELAISGRRADGTEFDDIVTEPRFLAKLREIRTFLEDINRDGGVNFLTARGRTLENGREQLEDEQNRLLNELRELRIRLGIDNPVTLVDPLNESPDVRRRALDFPRG
jgi:hypothetical protein